MRLFNSFLVVVAVYCYTSEPVCVVSIVGPCRDGKSYILGEAFGQSDVFSLGHNFDPETMGIWMWIVPERFQVKKTTNQQKTILRGSLSRLGACREKGFAIQQGNRQNKQTKIDNRRKTVFRM